ncbi:Palmitoyltransferase pfa5 [Sporothrix bragantina]|uniref:Palmitoyltransferase n=1 Tax=Sporothrix bragantina TaxID=671064 RepID=A0ABP0BWL7_9PEZI
MPPGARDNGGPAHSVNSTVRVMAVIIPCFLTLSVGYVLYAVTDYILMHQYYRSYDMASEAIGLTVVYSVIATIMVVTYMRLLYTIYTNPGVVPLGPEYARDFYGMKAAGGRRGNAGPPQRSLCEEIRAGFGNPPKGAGANKQNGAVKATPGSDNENIDLESGLANSVPYGGVGSQVPAGPDPRLDPDSPGLELFYTKDVFECTADGRPIWCTPCGTWKPDRAHHCSEISRCVLKMDHYCPWVGGIVSETTFKYFIQFTFYATILCGLTIGTSASAIWQRKHRQLGSDPRIIVALALSSILGLFSFAMFATCLNFVLQNITTVESHQLKDRVKMMAVRIKRGSDPVVGSYNVITYPLPKDDWPPPQYGAALPPTQPASTAGVDFTAATGPGSAVMAPDSEKITEETDPFKVNRAARAARRQARDALDARDLLAYRTFAIVSVPKGMNVWNLGWCGNWKSVMGTNVFDWFLPIHGSPCSDHSSTESLYKLSPAFRKHCAEMNLPSAQDMEEQRHF